MDFDALQEYNSPAVPSEVLENWMRWMWKR